MNTSSSGIEERKDVSIRLHEVEGIKFGDFTLTSGKKSPYYIDLRLLPSYPNLFESFVDLGRKKIEEKIEEADRLAGVPTAGLPFATLLSNKTGLPLLYTREKAKSHGRERAIEGIMEKGDLVIIIDDLTTTGGSIKTAASIIRKNGGKVEDAMVMLDREEGAKESLKEAGIDLHACLKISEVIKYLKEESLLSEDRYSLIVERLKN